MWGTTCLHTAPHYFSELQVEARCVPAASSGARDGRRGQLMPTSSSPRLRPCPLAPRGSLRAAGACRGRCHGSVKPGPGRAAGCVPPRRRAQPFCVRGAGRRAISAYLTEGGGGGGEEGRGGRGVAAAILTSRGVPPAARRRRDATRHRCGPAVRLPGRAPPRRGTAAPQRSRSRSLGAPGGEAGAPGEAAAGAFPRRTAGRCVVPARSLPALCSRPPSQASRGDTAAAGIYRGP